MGVAAVSRRPGDGQLRAGCPAARPPRARTNNRIFPHALGAQRGHQLPNVLVHEVGHCRVVLAEAALLDGLAVGHLGLGRAHGRGAAVVLARRAAHERRARVVNELELVQLRLGRLERLVHIVRRKVEEEGRGGVVRRDLREGKIGEDCRGEERGRGKKEVR